MRFKRRDKEAELREELQFHLDEEAEERAAAGVPEQEARYAARRDLGNLTRIMEETRAAWGWGFCEAIRQDLGFAFRSLRRTPAFTLLIVLILGLGIGANTAVFSVVDSVILKPLAYRDAGRIVVLATFWKKPGVRGQISAPDFHDWERQSTSFEAMAAYQSWETAVVTGSGAGFAVNAFVGPQFFQVFSVKPVLGRLFSQEESQPGSSAAALLSYSFWQSHYPSDPNVLGKTIRLDGHALPIVGVLPPGFHFPDKTDIWLPANTIFPEVPNRSAHNLHRIAAKLKPGVTLQQAQAEMTVIGNRLEAQYPRSNRGKNISVILLRDELLSDSRTMLLVLLGAVGLVLLVACGNVANLLLARAAARGREIAVRAAIGASRLRIVRQLFTESLFLALVSGVAGLLIAMASFRALVSLAPAGIPRLADTRIDGSVLAFAFVASVLACLLFGLAPAFHAARADLNDALKAGAAWKLGGGRSRLRSGLVVAEIALSVVLLSGAGLLLRSFAALHDVALGYQPENVIVMFSSTAAKLTAGAPAAPGLPDEAGIESIRVYKRLLSAAAQVPGVIAVGATRVPPGEVISDGGYWIDQAPKLEQITINGPQAAWSIVTPGAFAALGIPLKRGRDFDARDTLNAPSTAIINETLARRSFPGQDPIGHTIAIGFDLASFRPMRIVGVVGDVRQRGPARNPDAEIYIPDEQHPQTQLSIVARTALPPEKLETAFRRLARQIAPDVPVKFTTMQTQLSQSYAAPRFRTLLLSIFGALAVILAMAGIYAVMSFMVNRRAGEIGLRMALGAASSDVMAMVLSTGGRLAVAGLAFGLVGSLAATRLLSAMLFGITPRDPLTYAAVLVLTTVVAFAASYAPAHRAARIDPSMALRQE